MNTSMSNGQSIGQCLCGNVRIKATLSDPKVGACHCDICRTWGGGPLLALDGGTEVQIEGADCVTTFASSPWAERAFCSKCGAHLFIRVNQSGRYILPVGLFPNRAGLVFDHQIFIERKPDFYSFANETTCMTGDEVFGKHAPQST